MTDADRVREQFIRAGKEFGFRFISPYRLDEETGLTAFGCLCWEHSSRKRVIELLFHPTPGVIQWCEEHDLFLSIVNPEILSGEYDSSIFAEMMEDWKYDG